MSEINPSVDVIVVGAGLAGLTCARSLQATGYTVTVLEKSRGLGGRLATRRLHDTWIDHGTNSLEHQGEATRSLLATLQTEAVIHPWVGHIGTLSASNQVGAEIASGVASGDNPPQRYYAPGGITAIAKYLGRELNIQRQHRVVHLKPLSDGGWELRAEVATTGATHTVSARTVVLAIPAPQALDLVQQLLTETPNAPLQPAALTMLQSVQFDPGLSVMAGYESAGFEWVNAAFHGAIALRGTDHPTIAWLGQTHTKAQVAYPTLLLQTTAQFTQDWLDQPDVTPAIASSLASAAIALGDWITQPSWTQIHRWRYARVKTSLPQSYLELGSTPATLLACGDWCGGNQGYTTHIEAALRSGQAVATALS